MKKIFLLLLFAWISLNIHAQDNKDDKFKIKYKSGDYFPTENIKKGPQPGVRGTSQIKGKKHVLIQFHDLPSEVEKENLKTFGIVLLEYIPNNAYWGYLEKEVSQDVLASNNIRSIESIKAEHKISNELKDGIPEHAEKEKGKADLRISYFKNVSIDEVKKSLLPFNAKILKELPQVSQIEIRVDKDKISQIATIDGVSFVYPIAPTPTPNNYKSVKNNKANILKSNYSWGKGLSGEGVVVGVGDGGYVTPHVDLQNRVINLNFDPPVYGVHGDHVSGTVGGAGNKNPKAQGMAHKATILTNVIDHFIYNGSTYYNSLGMVLTNNSYGYQGSTYDYNSRLLDLEMRNNPSLQHVFAAHNYGSAYGTIAGGWTRAKNVLTVGSTTYNDGISFFSSRGPVDDGRLKPEIVAMGENVLSTVPDNSYSSMSGTSMAAPAVTGTLALLYQRYKQLNQGINPKSALMKALVCNTADDFGNTGPDYSYGFGRINGRRAAEVLESKQYFSGQIDNGQAATFNVTVPTNASELKVMLYWNDVEASVGASPALVQNLDLTVSGTSGVFRPWVLNASDPGAVATRGVDNVNNIEQVTIPKPQSGSYTFSVSGTTLPFGTQEYFVVYEIVKPHILVTYPIEGESIKTGEYESIHWDASDNGPVNIDYSPDNGATWENIATSVPANRRQWDWQAPNQISGAGKIRISDGKMTALSAGTFSIMHIPNQLSASSNAHGEITLSWAAVQSATYDVFLLAPQDTLIKLIASTNNTSYTFKGLTPKQTYWMSVRAKNGSAISPRAVAISAQPIEVQYKESESPEYTERGIHYSYYDGSFSSVQDLIPFTPVKKGEIANFDLSVRNRDDEFGFKFHGFFHLPEQGEYTFFLKSDDGSRLYIGDQLIVDNDGLHGSQEKSGKILLKPGYHSFTVYYFERAGGEELTVSFSGPTIQKMVFPDFFLKRTPSVVNCFATGTAFMEIWNNVTGTTVSSIPTNTAPDETKELSILEAPLNTGDNYGSRIRGYFCAPQSGNYVFYISGDDNAELWLSTNHNPANKTRIAHVPGWTNYREWTKYPEQKSVAKYLTAGVKYYFEVLHKEGSGGDNVAVGWELPNSSKEMPIPGSRLAPYEAPLACSATGTISREQWNNIQGTEISDIPLSVQPSSTSQVSLFEGPVNIADNYGSRYRGYVCAPQTGNYTFWIASDDKSELWLSLTSEVSKKTKIAYVYDWTNLREWEKYPTQKSATVFLEAGKKYYIEALHKEATGGDNLSVGWQLPDGNLERPIPGSRLSPYVPEGVCENPSPIYQEVWFNVPGNAANNVPIHLGPDQLFQRVNLDGLSDFAENYGSRIRGYVCAPESGEYTFYIGSDDNSELYLSSNEDPTYKRKIAFVEDWTSPYEFSKYAGQTSNPITLKGQHQYYFEVLHKEGGNGDHVEVGWELPSGKMEYPIAQSRLIGYNGGPINLALNKPSNPSSVADNNLASYAVDGNLATQWKSNLNNPEWIIIDLQKEYNINRVRVIFGENYPIDFFVQTSNDAANWKNIYYVQGNTTTNWDFTAASQNARYVRVYSSSSFNGNGISIQELEVYGTEIPSSPGASVREEAEGATGAESVNCKVYPVPTSDQLNVQFTSMMEEEVRMTVFNSVMQPVLKIQTNVGKGKNNISFSTTELSNGIYFLNFKLKDKVISKKIQVLK